MEKWIKFGIINPQIIALQFKIENLKKNKTLTLLDEFLIMVWQRSIRILEKQNPSESQRGF
jgi:hypothetical protein